MSTNDNHINYVEFKAKDLEEIKEFYIKAFGWTFSDYGPTYTAFSNSGLEGGFEKSEDEIMNGALIVLYHENPSCRKSSRRALRVSETWDLLDL